MAETPMQRYRRIKRDPLRAQVLATSYTVPPVRCGTCNHSEIMHRGGAGPSRDERCLSYGCRCLAWCEHTEVT